MIAYLKRYQHYFGFQVLAIAIGSLLLLVALRTLSPRGFCLAIVLWSLLVGWVGLQLMKRAHLAGR
ncbi:hypothetical protein [Chromobacterium sp. IIBBL 290-4]|uniref:hypothetical protein n=1 Tax=Chromobacterium sp. IIBBL 290-4 TaxID=2953890 RepID=UPI0020B74C8A|nr:hypothetical protein [Chromobacterium sp. IIBBL 290-4]UTH75218.1 hypothetical protein NKT35_03715 [Chromobacterium sp. IIBBL 290-4]